MNLNEAKDILNKNGFILEDVFNIRPLIISTDFENDFIKLYKSDKEALLDELFEDADIDDILNHLEDQGYNPNSFLKNIKNMNVLKHAFGDNFINLSDEEQAKTILEQIEDSRDQWNDLKKFMTGIFKDYCQYKIS